MTPETRAVLLATPGSTTGQASRISEELTQERLKQVLDYDPETGAFVWVSPPNNGLKPGRIAGSRAGSGGGGYLAITIDGRKYYAHRLAFLWMTGAMPVLGVDHINHNRDDNRWANLRLATQSQNNGNMSLRKDNISGARGVSWDKRAKKWHARIYANGRRKYLGLFLNIDDAAAAYSIAAREIFGEFANKAAETDCRTELGDRVAEGRR